MATVEIDSIIVQLSLEPKNVEALKKAENALLQLEKQAKNSKDGSMEFIEAMKKTIALERQLGRETTIAKNSMAGLEKEVSDLTEAQRRVNLSTQRGMKNFQALGKEIERHKKRIKDLNGATNGQASSLTAMAKQAGPALAAFFAVDKIISYGKEVVAVTAKFEKFEAVLTNTLGSKSQAQKALNQIVDFAAKTPFQVDELTDSFIKLANNGFRPTTQELTKLGDLAASKGKSFNQLTEAILDAQTFEFERLKEFGVRAQQSGNKVAFTFKGVKTEVDRTSDAVKDYILSLGDLEGVSGGMEAVSATLAGKLSNLEDNTTSLANAIGKILSPAFKGIVDDTNDFVKSITSAIKELQFNTALQKEIANLGDLSVEQIDTRLASAQKRIDFIDNLLAESQEREEKHGKGFLASDRIESLNREIGELTLLIDSLGKARTGLVETAEKEKKDAEKKTKEAARLRAELLKPFLELQEQIRLARLRAEAELEKDPLIKLQRLFDVDEQQLIADFNKKIEAFKEKGLKSGASKQAIEEGVRYLRETLGAELAKLTDIYNREVNKLILAELEANINAKVDIELDLDEENLDSEFEDLQSEIAGKLASLDRDFQRQRIKIALEAARSGNREQELKDLIALEEKYLKDRLLLMSAEMGASVEMQEFEEEQLRKIIALKQSEVQIEEDALKRRKEAYIDFAKSVASTLNKLFEFQIGRIDDEVAYRQDRIQYLQNVQSESADRALQEEEQRQAEALQERERFVRAQQIIGAIEAAVNIGVGISKVFAESGLASLGTLPAVLGVLTAVLAGVPALVKPLLGFKDGVIDFKGRGTETSDSNVVSISNRESVITAKGTKNAPKALELINKGLMTDAMVFPKFEPVETANFAPAMNLIGDTKAIEQKLAQNNALMAELIAKMQSPTHVDYRFDENGFTKRIKRQNRRAKAIENLR